MLLDVAGCANMDLICTRWRHSNMLLITIRD